MGVQSTLIGTGAAVASAASGVEKKIEKVASAKPAKTSSSSLRVKNPSAVAAEKAQASLAEHVEAKKNNKQAISNRIGLMRSKVKPSRG